MDEKRRSQGGCEIKRFLRQLGKCSSVHSWREWKGKPIIADIGTALLTHKSTAIYTFVHLTQELWLDHV